jgi:hypothetical protein
MEVASGEPAKPTNGSGESGEWRAGPFEGSLPSSGQAAAPPFIPRKSRDGAEMQTPQGWASPVKSTLAAKGVDVLLCNQVIQAVQGNTRP